MFYSLLFRHGSKNLVHLISRVFELVIQIWLPQFGSISILCLNNE